MYVTSFPCSSAEELWINKLGLDVIQETWDGCPDNFWSKCHIFIIEKGASNSLFGKQSVHWHPVTWPCLLVLWAVLFQRTNSVFLLQQISEHYFQSWLFSEMNRALGSWLTVYCYLCTGLTVWRSCLRWATLFAASSPLRTHLYQTKKLSIMHCWSMWCGCNK
jgi:hypothetical protein